MPLGRRILVGAVVVTVAVAALFACTSSEQVAAFGNARTQYGEMRSSFAENAPVMPADRFVSFVRGNGLDEMTRVGFDSSGEIDLQRTAIRGQSTRVIYRASASESQGVLHVLLSGYASPRGWGSRAAMAYSCLSATFDLEHGGEPEFADVTCDNMLRGSIGGEQHVPHFLLAF